MNRKMFFLPVICLLMVFASSCKQEKMTEEQIQSRIDQEVEDSQTELTEMYEARIDSILESHESAMKEKQMTVAPNPSKGSGKSGKSTTTKKTEEPKSTVKTTNGKKDPTGRSGTRGSKADQPKKDPTKRGGARDN